MTATGTPPTKSAVEQAIDDLTAEVANTTGTEDSVLVFIDGLQAQLASAGTDAAKLQSLTATLAAKRQAVAAAIATTPPASTTSSTSTSSSSAATIPVTGVADVPTTGDQPAAPPASEAGSTANPDSSTPAAT